MTVTISKPAINLREQLTELKATQGYEERQFWFDNLVTNGTFDTDVSGWGNVGTWVNGSVAWNASGYADVTVVGYQGVAQVISGLTVGATYSISLEVVDASTDTGRVYVGLATNPGTSTVLNQSTLGVGTHTFYFTASSTSHAVGLSNADGNGSVGYDNVSVYTSDGTDVAFAMPKGWKPLHVYDDGVLQREGSAEDYEVTFDGFNYYVKPTVANPGARNTVIGVRA